MDLFTSARTHHSNIRPSISNLMPGLLFSALMLFQHQAAAQSIQDFQAKFHVEAMGMNLGIAKHQWQCKQENCFLISDAKPSGLAALFFTDSSLETVSFKQSEKQLLWQGYRKVGFSEKNGTKTQKITELKLNQDTVVCPQKNKQWPVKEKMFDALSIGYAVWHAKLNRQSLDHFVLIDPNFQTELKLQSKNNNARIALDFGEDNMDAVKYHFVSPKADIELWLLPEFNYFPGKVRIKNQENKTLTLSLAEPPKPL
ncbi:DUF3108 domain-containing protein [Thiomicrorhabdus sediminis]|nr:DUF3108 domain-containing protein [Thiomicrorhabdus sediminis]